MDDKGDWGDRWNPKDDWEKQGDVIAALRDKDAKPLIDLLKSGGIPTRTLAEELAAMLEGSHPITTLEFKGHSGIKSWSDQLETERTRKQIGVCAEALVRAEGPGGFEAAIVEAQKMFPGRSRGYISKCRTNMLRILQRIDPQYRHETWQVWLEVWGPDSLK